MNSISEEYAVAHATAGSAPSEPMVSVRGLVKSYGRHEAVAGIDLEVRRGEIFAFLGPNGAGKTTTVEILEGFQRARRDRLLSWGTTRPQREEGHGQGSPEPWAEAARTSRPASRTQPPARPATSPPWPMR